MGKWNRCTKCSVFLNPRSTTGNSVKKAGGEEGGCANKQQRGPGGFKQIWKVGALWGKIHQQLRKFLKF